MRIKFTETRVVNDFRKGTPDEERFEAGKIYDLPEASAQRWLNRNAGVLATEKAEQVDPPPAIEIPSDWSSLKPKKLIALAKALGAESATAEDASAAIEAELARRATNS